MKKIIYIALALATLTIACTKSDLVDVPVSQNTPIIFDTYNGRVPVTKAVEITKDNISSIQVTGFQVAEGATAAASYTGYYMNPVVTRTKNNDSWGNWGYESLMYWPATGSLEFVAYGSDTPRANSGEGNLIPTDESYVNFTYTVPSTVANQKDLIVGYVPPTKAPSTTPSAVTFDMKHLLSRVGFKLATKGSGTSVIIHDVILHGTFKTTASVDLTAAGTEEDPILKASSATTTNYSLLPDSESAKLSFTTEDLAGTAYNGTTRYDIYATTSTATTGFTANAANRYMMILPGEVLDLENVADAHDVDNDNNITEDTPPYIEVNYQLGSAGKPRVARLALPKLDEDTNWTFNAGYAYEFVFEVSISEIKFTGTVQGWDDNTTPTPIY